MGPNGVCCMRIGLCHSFCSEESSKKQHAQCGKQNLYMSPSHAHLYRTCPQLMPSKLQIVQMTPFNIPQNGYKNHKPYPLNKIPSPPWIQYPPPPIYRPKAKPPQKNYSAQPPSYIQTLLYIQSPKIYRPQIRPQHVHTDLLYIPNPDQAPQTLQASILQTLTHS